MPIRHSDSQPIPPDYVRYGFLNLNKAAFTLVFDQSQVREKSNDHALV